MMRSVAECVLGVRSAVQLLTRVPVGKGASYASYAGACWTMAHLPLVGGLIGLGGAAVWILSVGLDASVRAWLVIAALLLLTGALHEDGLADTADALGGAFTRQRLFEILKDSRIGSYGALALIVALGLRAALLTRLLADSWWVLVLSQSVSRLTPVLLLYRMPYVSPEGTSRNYGVVQCQSAQSVLACVWALLIGGAAVHFAHLGIGRILLGLGMQAVAACWLGFHFSRRAGGVTGDLLGAAQQVSELALLLGLARW